MIVNGSFVTAKVAPNDVDVVILPGGDFPRGQTDVAEEELRWPFLEIIVADDDTDLERWALDDFGTNRDRQPKGVVEVRL